MHVTKKFLFVALGAIQVTKTSPPIYSLKLKKAVR